MHAEIPCKANKLQVALIKCHQKQKKSRRTKVHESDLIYHMEIFGYVAIPNRVPIVPVRWYQLAYLSVPVRCYVDYWY